METALVARSGSTPSRPSCAPARWISLWLGDSITQDFEHAGPEPWRNFQPVWQRFYAATGTPINLGFNGDATAHLLWRIDPWRDRGHRIHDWRSS